MARITVEDCLEKVSNRFELVLLASKRARQLIQGAKPLVATPNREIVTALWEIAVGKVRPRETAITEGRHFPAIPAHSTQLPPGSH